MIRPQSVADILNPPEIHKLRKIVNDDKENARVKQRDEEKPEGSSSSLSNSSNANAHCMSYYALTVSQLTQPECVLRVLEASMPPLRPTATKISVL
ncbi:hypothetical protein EXN66_Car021253 [Channa argus]|uniref:Uncharacterized protein n=1 Tax=Channa argus TaxID=215402 RepID=A0A6G1QSI9_CHAAH|nr:hypothetical protein EXN66_Car021253 [Channa argus]